MSEIDLTIAKGVFGGSLNTHPERPIALLHLDGDLYKSYKDGLHYLYDKVGKNGVIISDDFHGKDPSLDAFLGSRRAVKECFADKY